MPHLLFLFLRGCTVIGRAELGGAKRRRLCFGARRDLPRAAGASAAVCGELLVSTFPKSAKKPIICALGIDKMGEKWYNIQDCTSPARRDGEKGATPLGNADTAPIEKTRKGRPPLA